jgi:tetratricopeptide (TPR) repeat protein
LTKRFLALGGASVALLFAATSCSGPATKDKTAAKTSSFSTLLGAGVALLQRDNPNAAAQLFQQAIKDDGHVAVAYYDLGVADQQQKETSQALSAYDNALSIDPRYVPAMYNKATIYASTSPTLAISLYRRIVGLQPDAPTAYLNLGLLEAAQPGGTATAHAYLQTAVTLKPDLLNDIPAPLRAGITAPGTPG